MKETINELSKKADELCKTETMYRTAMDAMATVDIPSKREAIEELRKKRKEASDQLENVRKAIRALQEVCTHVTPEGRNAFRYSGNDSHYTYETCDICGTEQKT